MYPDALGFRKPQMSFSSSIRASILSSKRDLRAVVGLQDYLAHKKLLPP
jgi:hypothetical protein